MKTLFVGCIHFNHKNVIPYCNRPYKDVEEMNSEMLRIWNETVNPEDTIWFLGDLDINPKRSHRDLVSKLNGHKKLIVGNHCMGFQHQLGRPSERVLRERQQLLDYGWEEVHQTKVITLKNGRNVLLSHLPYLDEKNSEYDLRYKDLRPKDQGMTMIHSHQHARYIKSGRMIDVGFDGKLGMYTEDEIIELINDPRDYIESRITEFYKQSKPRVLTE